MVDYVIQRLADDNVVDIFGLVSEFRQRRPFMVQTEVTLESFLVFIFLRFFSGSIRVLSRRRLGLHSVR